MFDGCMSFFLKYRTVLLNNLRVSYLLDRENTALKILGLLSDSLSK